jgi:hypothetical protein
MVRNDVDRLETVALLKRVRKRVVPKVTTAALKVVHWRRVIPW